MTVKVPVVVRPSDNSIKFTYTLVGTDTGTPIHEQHADYSDRSVQILGTFSTNGSVTIEGSNDGTNYVALTDPQGNAITKTAAGFEQIMEAAAYMRPNCTVGDGTVSLTVVVFCRKPKVLP